MGYAMLLPAFYGLILGDPITLLFLIGLVMFAVSLFLLNYRKPSPAEKRGQKIRVRWIVLLVLSLPFSGFTSIFQKMEQLTVADPRYNNSFMILALAISAAVFLVLSFIFENKELRKATLKKNSWLPLVCGACNGTVNLFVMKLNDMNFPASVMFPVISASCMVVIFAASVLFFKEKFTKMQLVGFFVGTASIVLLSI